MQKPGSGIQRRQAAETGPEGESAADPMDIWLKQQLGGLHSEMLSEALPDELGALAAALEARLGARAAAGACPPHAPEPGACAADADADADAEPAGAEPGRPGTGPARD